MSGSKHFDKIAMTITAVTLLFTILFCHGAALGIQATGQTLGYENRLFDNTKVHTIDIVMDDWDSFIASATSEEYAMANLVIDGEAYKNVGIRGKGNTSLSTVASMDSDRYSFKVEFDQYDKTKSYYGLDKLCLNNLIQDATMMKDYLTYTMMTEFGVDAPLCSFVYITVNGEDWGLYLAVEGIEDGFLTRNYGTDHGNLYKPDSMNLGGGRGNGKDFEMGDFDFGDFGGAMPEGMPEMGEMPGDFSGTVPDGMTDGAAPSISQNEIVPKDMPRKNDSDIADRKDKSPMPQNGDGTLRMGGFSLDEDTILTLWDSLGLDEALLDGIDLDNVTMQDVMNLVGKLDGDTLRTLMDAVQGSDFMGKFDFGGMGSFGMGSSDVKLQYIDDEYDSYSNIWDNAKTSITDRDKDRLIASLKKLSSYTDLENVVDIDEVLRYFVVHNYVVNGDSYTGSMIHNYYLYEKNGQLSMIPWDYNLAFGTFQGGDAQSSVNEPIDSPVSDADDRPMWGWILSDGSYRSQYHEYFAEFLETVDVQSIIENAYALIQPYVEKDPTKFYTTEEFEVGVTTLKQFCALRSASIEAQLRDGETKETKDYANASDVQLSDMGSMNMGGGMERDERMDTEGERAAWNEGEERVRPAMEGTPQMPSAGRPGNTAWMWLGISVLLLAVGIVIAKAYRR